MSLHPDKLPLIHGLVDGELDAANVVAIETHLKGCADCRAELEQVQAIREMIAVAPLRVRAPEALHERIDLMIDAEAGSAQRASVASHRASHASRITYHAFGFTIRPANKIVPVASSRIGKMMSFSVPSVCTLVTP